MFFLLTVSDADDSDIEVSNCGFVTNLYEKYGRTLWKYAFKLSNSSEVSSDIISTTFLKVIEKVDIIKKIHTYKIKSYLMSMVKNTYLNYINKEKSNIDLESISEYSLYNPENDFTEKFGVSEIEETLSYMPEPYKSILIYRYVYDEVTYEEIALALNINAKNIRVYKRRALDMLKQRMKGGESNRE